MTGDPIVIPHNPHILIGGAPSPCSPEEWVMTQLRKGDRVRITPNPKRDGFMNQRTQPYDAVWRRSWLGLALTGEVRIPDPDDLICESVIPECGDRIQPLDRPVIRELDVAPSFPYQAMCDECRTVRWGNTAAEAVELLSRHVCQGEGWERPQPDFGGLRFRDRVRTYPS